MDKIGLCGKSSFIISIQKALLIKRKLALVERDSCWKGLDLALIVPNPAPSVSLQCPWGLCN